MRIYSKKGTYHYMKRVKHIIHCPSNISGSGIVIAVMDTGAVKHPEVAGRFLLFKDFVNGIKIEEYLGKVLK